MADEIEEGQEPTTPPVNQDAPSNELPSTPPEPEDEGEEGGDEETEEAAPPAPAPAPAPAEPPAPPPAEPPAPPAVDNTADNSEPPLEGGEPEAPFEGVTQETIYTSLKEMLAVKGLISEDDAASEDVWNTAHQTGWNAYTYLKRGQTTGVVPWSVDSVPEWLAADPDFALEGVEAPAAPEEPEVPEAPVADAPADAPASSPAPAPAAAPAAAPTTFTVKRG